MRNPGVLCLWMTRSYELFKPPSEPGQTRLPLITIGEPHEVTWWRERRPATRDEVLASIDGGLATLLQAARVDGPIAFEHLNRSYERAKALFPPEVVNG